MKPDKTTRTAGNDSFNELLSDLSLHLLKANPRNIDNEIHHWVGAIGMHYHADRVDIRKISEDLSHSTPLHCWVRSDAVGLVADIENDQIPWAASRILRGESISIGKLADLPAEATSERASMEHDGISAAVLVPLIVDEQVYGSLYLASQAERVWPDEVIREVRSLGDALAVAYSRAQHDNELWASEQRCRAVLENQTDFIVRWLPDGTRTWVNDRYCEFFQQSRKSMIGTSFLPLLQPDGGQKLVEIVEKITVDNPTSTHEHKVLLPSGEFGWQQWTDKGLFDDSGQLIEIQSVGFDITDRRNAEEAKLKSETRYRNLVENTSDWIWEMNLDLEHTYSNHQLEVILGYTSDEIKDLSFSQLFHPEDQPKVEERLRYLIEDKSGWEQWVNRCRHKNGSYRYLQSSAHPVFDANGDLCGYHGSDRDITDSVISRDIIEKSEDKYRTLFESANDVIFLLEDERITDCNSKALEVFGRNREDFIGSKPWDLSPAHQPDGTSSEDMGRSMLKEVYAGKLQRFVWVHTRGDGSPIEMDISLTIIELTDDSPRLLAVARDITDTKQAQREIERRADFQHRLATLSSDLLRSSSNEVIGRCGLALEDIAEEYAFDNAELWWFPSDGESITRLAAWNRDGTSLIRPPESLPMSQVSWSKPLLLAGDYIKIEDVGNMPADAKSEQALLQGYGFQSLLAIPGKVGDEPLGACACIFSSAKPRELPDDMVEELQLLSAPLANALTSFQAAKEITRQAEFESLMAQLSTDFLTASPDRFDDQIEQALGLIGCDYGIERISLWWLSHERGDLKMHAAWQHENDTRPNSIAWDELTDWPWAADFVRSGKVLKIGSAADMPAEAHIDQAQLQRLGFSAALIVPMMVENVARGCCVFLSVEERRWDRDVVAELKQLVELLANAVARMKATAEITLRERDLTRSQEAARVGSFSLAYPTPQTELILEGQISTSAQFRELFELEIGKDGPENVLSRIHPDDRERVLQTVRNAFASNEPVIQTFRVIKPDDTIMFVEDRSEFIRDDNGQVTRWFGTDQDVTEQVESRNKIEHALAEIQKLKDQLQEENLYLRQEIRAAHGFDKIIGDSPQLRQALLAGEKVAPTDVPVLILGETGTGKELVAQAIHDISNRKDNALISVNCAALSSDLIESELFGHEKGSFTGAHQQRKGRFELADGGTLFLDEVGELHGEQQAKLLRVLQTGDFERLGGSQTLQVDVRLIAATNKNLKRAVDNGEFRADLYYRISSFPIEMPPLRERPEDIPALAEFLVRKHAQRMGKEIQSISSRTLRYLGTQSWPGNVRELEGFIQRALIATVGPVLDYSEGRDPESESAAIPGSGPADASTDLRGAERSHILKVLEKNRWVIDGRHGAAFMLGVAPSTLRSKMKRLGIKRPAQP